MIRIEIVPDIKKRMAEDNKYVRDLMAGKVPLRPAIHTHIFTPETFASTFSPERIRLMLVLRNWEGNIYQLAKKLGRPYEAVHRDISYLEGPGFIKVKSVGRKRYPRLAGPIRIPAFA